MVAFRISFARRIAGAVAGMLLVALTACAGAAEVSPMPKDFTITLERGICFGRCPAYRVSVDVDGTVSYDGKSSVAVKGSATHRIPRADVEKLYHAFQDADFFAFEDRYRSRATDLPTYRLTLTADGRTKTVTDYGGRMIDMPEAITKLENMVDDIAGTDAWVHGAKAQ